MDYDLYKEAIEYDEASPAREALSPYWERLILIANSEDPQKELGEQTLGLGRSGALILATGGPQVELTLGGELRANWRRGWIYSQPRSYSEEMAAKSVLELVDQLKID